LAHPLTNNIHIRKLESEKKADEKELSSLKDTVRNLEVLFHHMTTMMPIECFSHSLCFAGGDGNNEREQGCVKEAERTNVSGETRSIDVDHLEFSQSINSFLITSN